MHSTNQPASQPVFGYKIVCMWKLQTRLFCRHVATISMEYSFVWRNWKQVELSTFGRDAGCSKLLSWGTRCDHCKTSISIYQKKALGELYRLLPLSSCMFNVCMSYAHYHFFPYNWTKMWRCSVCTAPTWKVNIFAFFPYNWMKMRRRSACTALTRKVNIFAWRPFSGTNSGMTFQYLL